MRAFSDKKKMMINTAKEWGFLTCNVLTLKRFMALQIAVPLETNQFKKHRKDLASLLKLKYS